MKKSNKRNANTAVRYDEATQNRVRKALVTMNNKDAGEATGVTTSYAYATRKRFKIAFPGRGKNKVQRKVLTTKKGKVKRKLVKSDLL